MVRRSNEAVNNRKYVIATVLALAATGYWLLAPQNEKASAASEESEEAEGEEHGEGHADSTVINPEAAEAVGIEVEEAASATILETVTLSGRITLNQNRLAQVEARFPGIVREVRKGQGEMVEAGEVLATVESNDSLQPYPVKSPISGVILARSTNVGDVAAEAPLFTIADVSDVWAEFHVFPRDISRIEAGQRVRVTSFEGGHSGEAAIAVILPLAESSSQTVVARVTLPNPEGTWRAGMTVRGEVLISERQVPLAVRTPAIQRMEGKSVVFVQEGERFEMRPVKTGASDKDWTEVKEGLKPGDAYVRENSFLIKADIGKAAVEDED